MSAPTLDTLRVAPLSLAVRNGVLDCPRRGRVRAGVCDRCRYLQGSLNGADPAILCGLHEPRLAIIRPIAETQGELLIFDMDWPDD